MMTFVLANEVYFQCFCIHIRPLQVQVFRDPSLQPFEVKMLIVALRNLHKGVEKSMMQYITIYSVGLL